MFKPPKNLIQNNSFSLLHCKWLNWTKTGKPVSQRYPEISQRLKKRRRGPWAKCAWLFLSFLLETLTIITVQLYNLAPLQMRGHPRPDDEVAVSSGDKFTLGWRSTISHSSPGPIWREKVRERMHYWWHALPDQYNVTTRQTHLGSVTSEVVVCPRRNLHALKISACY